jgi:SAM-dependent methyltransferase
MVAMTSPHIDRVRALSFGAVAASYDRLRPRYPDRLVDDVVAMLPGRNVLEVGAGTGIATAAFAARGMAMTCVEPDAAMAAVLTAKLAGNPELRLDVATFQDWSAARPAGAPGFDGLVCGQAWHWTDPATRWADAAAALREGGVLALFWNDENYADPRIPQAYTAAYDRRGIEIRTVWPAARRALDQDRIVGEKSPDGWLPKQHRKASGFFTALHTRQYHWSRRVPVTDYVAGINTSSAHLILPPEVRDDLTAELVATLAGYGDDVVLEMTTDLATAIRR